MKKILATAAAAVLSMGTMASAASFTLDLDGLDGINGTADDAVFTSIPGGLEGDQPTTASNAVLQTLQAQVPGAFQDPGNFNFWTLNGYQGAQVLFSGGKVRAELFGWEASWFNAFNLDGNTVGKGLNGLPSSTQVVAVDVNTPLDAFVTGVLGAGLLGFDFTSTRNGPIGNKGGVTNGLNPIVGNNFFVSCEGNAAAILGLLALWAALIGEALTI